MNAANRRRALWSLQNFRCCWCGKPIALEFCTLEHIVPQALGGGNHFDNTAVAHELCNKTRGANYLQEPAPGIAGDLVRRRLARYFEGIAKQDISKLKLPVPAVRWSSQQQEPKP